MFYQFPKEFVALLQRALGLSLDLFIETPHFSGWWGKVTSLNQAVHMQIMLLLYFYEIIRKIAS